RLSRHILISLSLIPVFHDSIDRRHVSLSPSSAHQNKIKKDTEKDTEESSVSLVSQSFSVVLCRLF
ncbi:hypothetical protein ACFVHQ_22525, partial [Actinomycetes bacterium NPDC127524]